MISRTPVIFVFIHSQSLSRSSSQEVFLGRRVLNIFSKFTGEHPCRSLISTKLPSNFIEIAFRHRCSPVNLLYIFRRPFFRRSRLEGCFCVSPFSTTRLSVFHSLNILGRNKNILDSGNGDDEKNLYPGGCNYYFLINLTDFFKWSFHLQNYSNSAFLCWETNTPNFHCSKRKKRQFVRIN